MVPPVIRTSACGAGAAPPAATAPMQAAQRIDARGMIVAPGFIDAHTHADGFLRAPDPAQRVNAAWLDQGVSTVVIGVDGYGTPDVGADAARIEASRVGTNFIPFVGFGAVRQQVLGQDARAPNPQELAAMKALVAKAYKHCKDTLTANRDVWEELTEMLIEKETVDYKELQELVAKYYPNGVDNERIPLPAAAALM